MPENPYGGRLTEAQNAANEAITQMEDKQDEYDLACILHKRKLADEGTIATKTEREEQVVVDSNQEGGALYELYQELKEAKRRWRNARDMKDQLAKAYKAHNEMGFGS